MKNIGEHPLGMCFYNENRKHAYYNIPKNASMSLRGLFLHNNYKETNINLLPLDTSICVVLRDPVDRFISSVNMYLGKRNYDFILDDTRFTRNVNLTDETLITNDEHFKEQSFYVDLIKDFNTKEFFILKKSIIDDISEYYSLEKNLNIHQNRSPKIVLNIDKNYIHNIYNKDFNILKTTKFINNA